MNIDISNATCTICNGTMDSSALPEYRQCQRCGHFSYAGAAEGGPVTNQAVDGSDDRQPTRLQLDQAKTVRAEFDGEVKALDLGCGDGGFLHALGASPGPAFDALVGVEVDPASLERARAFEDLRIVTDVEDAGSGFAAITAWHSAEHFPVDVLQTTLRQLRTQMAEDGKVLIAVPNGASLQQRWFRDRWAFHDDPNHRSVFTPTSLDSLMRSAGFVRAANVRLPRYGLFAAVQSSLNLFIRPHNALYSALKRGSVRLDRKLVLKHAIAAPLAGLIAVPFMLAELSPGRAASFNAWYEPDPDLKRDANAD